MLGPTNSVLHFWGLILIKHKKFYFLLHICGFVCVSTQYIEIWNFRNDLDKILKNLYLTMLEHCLMCFYGGIINSSFDCNTFALLSFFAGQLKILSANCERLFGGRDERMNGGDAVMRIKECHYHHLYLVKYASLLNSLLSPIMFVHVLICSLIICASAMQFSSNDKMSQIFVVEYIVALIMQLFMFIWHCNEVLHLSNKIDDEVYGSAWWSQGIPVRRCLLLLGGQIRKPIMFTAGPFTQLNMDTFITILKASYTYYTLLASKDN
ncbi:odorant receptor Or2-like [Anticarsia gemmatalis]|uniref:odorant receptor Or2-like n=1 Tax=Anticarsia gemmatalis TaxID=129554 RepID=UPI003F75B5AC